MPNPPDRSRWSWRHNLCIPSRLSEKHPSEAKALHNFVRFAARLKSCPFKTSAGSEYSTTTQCRNRNCGKLTTGRGTGRSLPEVFAQSRAAGGGKSELRRAVCRITSGTWALKPMDGQCHRKDTASATPLSRPFLGPGRGPPWKRKTRVGPVCRVRSPLRKLQRRGKGEMVR